MKFAVISNALPHGPVFHETHLFFNSDHYRVPVPQCARWGEGCTFTADLLIRPHLVCFSSCCRAFSGHGSEFLLFETKLEDACLENT